MQEVAPANPDEFPIHCLPPLLRDIAEEVSKASLVPVDLTASVALATASAALGAGLAVDTSGHNSSRGKILRGNIFLIGIAASGTGKGLAFDAITGPYFRLEQEVIESWESSQLPEVKGQISLLTAEKEREMKAAGGKERSQPARDEAIRKMTAIERDLEAMKKLLNPPRLVLGDTTQEAAILYQSLAPHEAIASLSGEARSIVDILMGRYGKGGNTDEQFYLQGFSGDPVRVTRMGRESQGLKRPCLSLLWLLQPDKAKSIFSTPALVESGFAPRCLWLNCRAEAQMIPLFPYLAKVETLDSWEELLRDLHEEFRASTEPNRLIHVSREVWDAFRVYHDSYVPRRRGGGDLHDIASFAARWHEIAWRVAIVLHAGKHGVRAADVPMSLDTAQKAIELVDWFAGQLLPMLTEGREVRQAEFLSKLHATLERRPAGTPIHILEKNHGYPREQIRALAKDPANKVEITEHQNRNGGPRATLVKSLAA
ncbi:DUF3987 domain-containing protein [Roseimicrobium sp. ORNL1]|uniref:DUF3987 domain-containing protein n=1 Tax=Roseimicrobium sp. ORNL1 TaxID=2711231 RepID=UPI0013E1BAD7|nr:DUF3987 domain-containing protein [Roseimicrobium sp. ORNL1]QIF01645.1 DUF3987 domain-containing protein [Roseimicrobium sp. ORNL1]